MWGPRDQPRNLEASIAQYVSSLPKDRAQHLGNTGTALHKQLPKGTSVCPNSPESYHSCIRFSSSGRRNLLWKALMDEILEKILFTTSTENEPRFASSKSLQ